MAEKKILLLNQCFYPDHVATAQHLTDLALALVQSGHQVTVVSSCRGYDDPDQHYPVREEWRGVDIHRIWTPGLGKRSKWRRYADFGIFWLNAMRILLLLPRHDLTVCLTSPPLISTLGTIIARLKGGKVVPWIMDLNPDEAVAAGWLKAGGLMERVLTSLQNWSFGHAEKIIALDRFMAERLKEKGVDAERIFVSPPWSHDQMVSYDETKREAFRSQHGLDGKYVVMYSGNHSPCHPLDAVLEASELLRDDDGIRFLFVGGGSEFQKVRNAATERALTNIVTLPYQPLQELSGSLSAADLHLVVLGDPFVGIVHPCKVYNILKLGIPFLALCPEPSHLTDLIANAGDTVYAHRLPNDDAKAVVDFIRHQAARDPLPPSPALRTLAERYSCERLRPALVELIATA